MEARARARRSRLPLSLTAAAVFVAGGATGALAWRACVRSSTARAETRVGSHEVPRIELAADDAPDATSVRSGMTARSAAEIVREFSDVHTPGFFSHLDEAEFDRRVNDAMEHQNRLAWELLDSHPRDREAPRLMYVRWSNLVNGMHRFEQVVEETTHVLSAPATQKLIAVAKRSRAQAAIPDVAVDAVRAREWLEEAVAAEPVDTAVAGHVLERFAELRTADPALQRELVGRAVTLYAKSAGEGQSAEKWGLLSVLNRLGTPLDLEFDDALGTGAWRFERGHPLVVHLWCAARWDLKTAERDPDVADIVRALPALTAAGVRVVAVERCGRNKGRTDAVEAARARQIAWPYAVEPARSNLEPYGGGGYSSFVWVDADGRIAAWCRRLGPLLEHAGLR